MKKLRLILMLAVSTILSAAALIALAAPADIPGFWVQERLGAPDSLLFFVDSSHGWAAHGDAIFRTEDGGASWSAVTFAQGGPGANGPVDSIYFVDARRGWAAGHKSCGNLRVSAEWSARTFDGGQTWQSRSRCFDDGMTAWYSSIYFYDASTGWWDDCRTADGGQTWTCGIYDQSALPGDLHFLRFTSRATGYATAGGNLYKTTDAGSSWALVRALPAWTSAVCVGPGAASMVAAGANGRIASSRDGGLTWQDAASPLTRDLKQCEFPTSQVAWVGGVGGQVARSEDAGRTWDAVDSGATSRVTDLAAAGFAYAWLYAGDLRRTRDAGAQWTALRSASAAPLAAVAMGSTSAGWAGGSEPTILGRDGQRWRDRVMAVGPIRSVDAVSPLKAWALSPKNLQRTADGGSTWETLPLPVTDAVAVDFKATASGSEGWLISNGAAYRSLDGGATWQLNRQCGSACDLFLALSVPDGPAGVIWLLGTRAASGFDQVRVLRSVDGGASWEERSVGGHIGCREWDIAAADASRAWLLTCDNYNGDATFSEVVATTDGGGSWTLQRGQMGGILEQLLDLDAVSATEVWGAGRFGRIVHTTDGGERWLEWNYPNLLTLRAVDAPAPGEAWFVGDAGQVLHYSASEPPGCWATPTPIATVYATPPPSGNIARRVAACVDDAYVRVDTDERLYDREYVRMGARDGGAVPYVDGFLFRNVRIPRGAAITSAVLRLVPEGHQSGAPVAVTLAGELQPQAQDFSAVNWGAHERPRTGARVPWTLNATATGATVSPDVAAIVEEIVAQPDWKPGNNLAILVDPAPGGQQYVNWKAYDLSAGEAAELVIAYRPQSSLWLPLLTK